MFLSIIIPVYSTERFLEECILSCLTQNIPATEYEIICVNDGSPDNSAEILSRFEKEYPNVKVITQANGGISRARNVGLDAAQGDYVWFVDSDDFIQKNCLDRLHRDLLTSNSDILYFDHYEFENQLNDLQMNQYENGTLPHSKPMHGGFVWNTLFRRSFLQKNHIRFPDDITAYQEDLIFWQYLTRCHPTSVTTNHLCYFYRRNAASITHNKSPEARQKLVYATYRHAQILLKHALEDAELLRDQHADSDSLCKVLMSEVRQIIIMAAAQLPADKRREIMDSLSAKKLFPLFLYRNPKDYFPKKIHMNHADIGIKGIITDFLYFYATTRIGYAMLLLYFKLYNKRKK